MSLSDGFIEDLSLPELGYGAGFALWSFRACARGCADCGALKRGFAHAFGEDASAALLGVQRMTSTFGHIGRRKLTLAMPGSVRITADELSLISMLAAAQAHDEAARDAHLQWLLVKQPAQGVGNLITGLADLFARHNLIITPPDIELRGAAPTPRQAPHLAFIHQSGTA